MSAFPETSMTLLRKIAVQVTGEREVAWVRFFGLYEPAIKRFVKYHDSTHDPDDVTQDIFLKLVNGLFPFFLRIANRSLKSRAVWYNTAVFI